VLRDGPYVLAEIASQPDCWARALEASDEAAKVLPGRGERVAITGCGTSWHVAAAIAAAREAAGHGETDAFPASELPVRAYDAVLAISRSGTTTEVLDALQNVPGPVRKIGITADASGPIRDAVDQLLVLDYADEQSVVQTLPLHRTAPAQEFPPRQEILLVPALEVTVEVQVVGPVHSTSQLLPLQLIGPLQEPDPEQVTTFMEPAAVTPPAQELVPLQVTVQGVPRH